MARSERSQVSLVVEKRRGGARNLRSTFFQISCKRALLGFLVSYQVVVGRLLRTPHYRLVMVNRIEFSAEPTDTYLMNLQYVSSFIAQMAFA